MGQIKVVNIQPNTPEWASWRIGKYGASNAAAILGECKFKTAYELWLEMTNRKPGFEGNAATEMGKQREPAARAAYEIDQGFVEAPEVCVEHPSYPFITASLDGYIEESDTVLEIKCPSQSSHDMALKGEVPRHYWIQMQHQLMVSGAKMGHYWSFKEGSGALVVVEPDLEFQAQYLNSLFAFRELVLSDTPPPLTEKDALIVEDNPLIESFCKRLVELKDQPGKESKEESESIKSSVIKMAGHTKVRCKDVLLSRSITKTGKESFRLTVRKEA